MTTQTASFLFQPAPGSVQRARSRRRVFQPGDQVRADRGLYWHHAIYIGDGWSIEFGSGLGGPVDWVEWDTFKNGNRIEFVRAGGDLAVNRAMGELGRNDFDLVFRNCEHFATWCTTGEWTSRQVQTAGVAALVMVGLVLIAHAKR